MGKLVYSAIASLDGYVNDADGNFDWAAPDAEVHAFVNDQERPIGTYLYGRRMYETMAVWETMDDPEPLMHDYAEIWRAADKLVFSHSLDHVTTPRTWLERELEPDAVRALKAEGDLSIGGPTLAALSNWYEFYYDVTLQGKFTFHIQELHKKYGKLPAAPDVA